MTVTWGNRVVFVPLCIGDLRKKSSFDHEYVSLTAREALVSTGDISLAHAAARNGMQCTQRLR